MNARLFTPLSARRTLHRVRAHAETMCRAFRSLETRPRSEVTSDQWVDPEHFSLLTLFHGAVATLRGAGVVIKDPRLGLLDFPARRAGKSVFLCWKVGEEEIAHWHETDAGFAGRRPVDEDGPWEEGVGRLENNL